MKDISEKNTHPDPPVRDSLKVWNRNFSWLMGATITGASGAIAASYGLSFLVFYETGSTLASALVLAVRVIPSFLLPLIAGPLLDRLPRKPVLVWGDFINGILYLIMGLWLMFQPFSYISYLLFSLIIACTSSVDELAFDSILPLTITKGCEQKSYAVTSMVYPLLNVVMMPAAALIMQFIGIPILLVLQGVLAVFASLMDSRIRIVQDLPSGSGKLDLKSWISDIREAAIYLRHQKGLLSFFLDSAITNGIASGCSPAMIKFFTITPGFTPLMYSAFSGAESLGRVLGGMGQYVKEMKNEVKYRFSVTVLVIYPLMDGILLFLSYPLMLVNRAVCGALGTTSYTLRTAAVQSYIPDSMRARINSFQNMLTYTFISLITLVFGALGDVMSVRALMVLGCVCELITLYLTWIVHSRQCRQVFEAIGQTASV